MKRREMYPGKKAPSELATVLDVRESKVAAIAIPGEIDLYKFEVTSAGTHVIQTMGETDMFMTLLDPQNGGLKLAEDDDNGSGRNSKIEIDLPTGEYLLQLRHFNELGAGAYRVMVSR